MTLLFMTEIAVKSALLLTGASFVGRAATRRGPTVRHMIWVVALLGVALLAPVSPLVPSNTILRVPEGAPLTPSTSVSNAVQSSEPGTPPSRRAEPVPVSGSVATPSFTGVFFVIWFGGFLFVSCRYGYGLLILSVIRRRGSKPAKPDGLSADPEQLARRAGIRSSWELRIATAPEPASAMTWGLLRPVVLLPRDAERWPAERLEAVLLHEFAHVRRYDFASQLLAEMACALYWFNPLAWYVARSMRADAELAADESVLRSGIKPSAYAAELLQIAAEIGCQRQPLVRAGIPVMSQSNIESRLHSVLSPTTRHRGVTSIQALLAILATALSVSGMASLRIASQTADGPRSKEEQTEALVRLKQAALATIMYSEDFDGDFPYAPTSEAAKYVFQPYAKNQQIFESPTRGGQFRFNVNIGGVNRNALPKPAETPLWSEHLPGKMNPGVAYVDGHARVIQPADMKVLDEALKKKYPRARGMKPLPATYGDK